MLSISLISCHGRRFSRATAATFSQRRGFLLAERMKEIVPKQKQEFKEWKKTNASKVLMRDITVKQAFGSKGIISLIAETSLLDENEGIKFRGYNIKEITQLLPKIKNPVTDQGEQDLQPLPEGMLWLLMTGSLPTDKEVQSVSEELLKRHRLPEITERLLKLYPKEMHPMTQLAGAVASISPHSKFRRAYFERVPKKDLWQSCFEDSIDLISKIPLIAAKIYRNLYHEGKECKVEQSSDWSENFSRLLGFSKPEFFEMMRLYLTIHSDHEGGNVSTHACHLVGSALSDPYISFSSAIMGLAGPLHGLANQEVLEFLKKIDSELSGNKLTKEAVERFIKNTLDQGQVVPGFGHAVLRVTDPRYTSQQEFAKLHIDQNDRLYTIVRMLHDIVPGILKSLGKVSNPYPNIDGHSGALLNYFGLKESNFYTVLFAVSRAIGSLSSLTIDRILEMPLERPKSVTTKWISENL